MIKKVLAALKGVLGENITNQIRPLGHGIKALLAAAYFRFPASKLTIIGVTGTKGKTSTTIYTGRLLNLSGIKSGYLSTAVVYDGSDQETNGNTKPFEELNIYKMTSLDGVTLHRSLRKMVNNGCKHVVIELSSQGLAQNRHWGLGKIDIGVFLNIYPEHLEAHGGWDNYLKAKSILFNKLSSQGAFIAPSDDPNAEYMWDAIPRKDKVSKLLLTKGLDYKIKNQPTSEVQLTFDGHILDHGFDAKFEAINCAFALRVLTAINRKEVSKKDLKNIQYITEVPGRMEWVLKDNTLSKDPEYPVPKELKETSVLVDYAHEPESIRQLLETLVSWRKSSVFQHVIHILSCDGVGRDDWKKPVMGDISYMNADYVVLTTDNYSKEDNPNAIVDLLSKNFPKDQETKKFIKEVDRRKAFQKALDYSTKLKGEVLIVSTGVGSEYGLSQPDGVMPWNESQVWQKLIEEFDTKPTPASESKSKKPKSNTKKRDKKTRQKNKKTSKKVTSSSK